MMKYVEIEKINPWVIGYTILLAIMVLMLIRVLGQLIDNLTILSAFLVGMCGIFFVVDKLLSQPLFVIIKYPVKEGKRL